MVMASILAGFASGAFLAVVLVVLGHGILLAFGGYVLGGVLGSIAMAAVAALRSARPQTSDEAPIRGVTA